jgi:hypothetical protein
MASTATRKPNYHSLSQPLTVGMARVIISGQYAGTVTTVRRLNTHYWSVTTREMRGAFSNPQLGVSAHVWWDAANGRYVADYTTRACQTVEAGDAYSVQAALAIAVDSTERRGHEDGRW